MPLAVRRFIVAGPGPVADECAALLAALAADVVRVERVTPGLGSTAAEGAIDATATLAATARAFPVIDVPAAFDAADAWARSGAMALTGEADGVPWPCPSATLPARVTAAGCVVQLLAATTFGVSLPLDALGLLGERAAVTGHTRRGSVSVGGACEMRRAADGWIALNLPRADDVALLPAWLDGDIDDPADATGMQRAMSRRTCADLVARGAELGLAIAAARPWPESVSSPYVIDGERPRPRRLRPTNADALVAPRQGHRAHEALVLDLSSLWAGPLAGGLLAQAGAQVVKVEGARRPDGARRGAAQFFDILNAGKRCIVIDFDDDHDIAILKALIARASLLIEGSRPRVMDRLGIDPAEVVARGTSWLSITAYGRDGAPRNRIGFGDDVAVSAGLTIAGDPPMFVADAVADPITGLYAAAAGLACLGATRSHLVDASLFRATRYVAHDSSSPAVSARLGAAAAPPRARTATAAAEAVGASTDEIVATFVPDARRDGRAKMPGPRSGEGDL